MAKVPELTAILEKRIERGDYALVGLPTELELAVELGVSRMTARRTIMRLINAGLVVRKPHGRLEINAEYRRQTGQLRLAFLAPAYSSHNFEAWRFAVERAATARGSHLRMVDFVHWDDPVISQTLTEFDGVFLIPSSEPIPPFVQDRFRLARNLIVVGANLSDLGVISLEMLPPSHIARLCEHLYGLGHRQIDCLNVQPHDKVVLERIENYHSWMKNHDVTGRIIDVPVEPWMPCFPSAYAEMKRILAAGQFTATGLICITEPAATGAIRAFYEAGLQVGRAVSVASAEGEGLARYQCPSRTVLEPQDPAPYLDKCIQWLEQGSETWPGSLLIQPHEVPLFVGESTGPSPRA